MKTRDANNYRAVPQLRNDFRGTEIRDNRFKQRKHQEREEGLPKRDGRQNGVACYV